MADRKSNQKTRQRGDKQGTTAVREQSKQLTASGSGARLKQPPLLRVFVAQIIALVLISALAYWVWGHVAALSAWLGGLVAVLPNGYFARRAFKFSGARAAADIARSFQLGEAGKFLLTAILFATVFAFVRPINIEVVFLVYIFMMALNWILALLYFKR